MSPPISSSSPKSPVLNRDPLLAGMSSAPTEVTSGVAATITAMKGSLGDLSTIFDNISEQTKRMEQMGGHVETAQSINGVRKRMHAHGQKHANQIQEIKDLLQEVLQKDVIEHLSRLIEADISSQIDDLVKKEVEQLLPDCLPKELQDEVASYKQQLAEVERDLHNSESRRFNAQLRTSRMTDPLHTIYKKDGSVSDGFPKDLGGLFQLDDDTAKILMKEYDLADISESRERNVNRFMQFCGVTYQLVPSSPGVRSPTKSRVPVVIERAGTPAQW